MGKLVRFSRRSPNNPDVFAPVNYRPTEQCRTLVFDPSDGNRYGDIFEAVAVQYALDESHATGYHMVELPDTPGPFLRYLRRLPGGAYDIRRHKAFDDSLVLASDKFKIVGYVFQFIYDLKSGDRWEFIRGPAFSDSGDRFDTLPLYDVSG